MADIFKCRIGNIPPHESTKITYEYVTEMPVEVDGSVLFVLPQVLNPRYSFANSGTCNYNELKTIIISLLYL